MILGAVGAKNFLPQVAIGFLGDLRNCYAPISLLLIGYMIAEYPIGSVFRQAKSYLVVALRLFIIPLSVLLVAWFLKQPKDMATLMLLTLASPCGMNVVLFPAAYGKDCSTGVSLVLPSSLGALITVPILCALLQLLYV